MRWPPRPPALGTRLFRTTVRASAHGTNGEGTCSHRHMMSNRTDMKDKYCGHSNDIHRVQSQYKGNHHATAPLLWWRSGGQRRRSGLNRVIVVAVITILVLHVGVIGYHVPHHYDFMFHRRSYEFVSCALARTVGSGGHCPSSVGLGCSQIYNSKIRDLAWWVRVGRSL